jgi:hypothetical protein
MEGSFIKRGRPGIELPDEIKDKIWKYMRDNGNMTYGELARKMRMSKCSIYNPMTGIKRCSPQSFKKIMKFVERITL